MSGPSLQVSSVNRVFDIQTDEEGKVVALTMRPDWAALFQSLQQIAVAVSRNGSSSARPASDFKGRYEGMPFFDRTLGLPVFLKHASSNVWVDAQGNPA